MATITELQESRQGDVLSPGERRASRTFLVELASGENEWSEVQAAFPRGTPHVNAVLSDLRVTDWRHVQKLTDLVHIFSVDYHTDNESFLGGWIFSWDSNPFEVSTSTDLNGQIIGPRVYRYAAAPDDGPPEPATHRTFDKNGQDVDLVLETKSIPQPPPLLPLEQAVRRPTTMPVTEREWSFSLRNRIPALSMSMVKRVANLEGLVNERVFMGVLPPRTVRFDRAGYAEAIEERRTEEGFSYVEYWSDTVLQFTARKAPWFPEELADTFQHEEGEAPVFNNDGQPMTTQYAHYREAAFENIFAILGNRPLPFPGSIGGVINEPAGPRPR